MVPNLPKDVFISVTTIPWKSDELSRSYKNFENYVDYWLRWGQYLLGFWIFVAGCVFFKTFEIKCITKPWQAKFFHAYINPLTTSVPHHIETSQLIRRRDQLTGFYIWGILVVDGLKSPTIMRFSELDEYNIVSYS